MKKIITSLSSALLILVASLSSIGVAKSAEFFTIGTGGPTEYIFRLVTQSVKCCTNLQLLRSMEEKKV